MAVTLIEYDQGRRAALVDFLTTFPDDHLSSDSWDRRLAWWWEGNPAAAGNAPGWLLEDCGRLVGFLGVIPYAFHLMETVAYVGNLTTWRVLDSHRGVSLSLLAQALQCPDYACLTDTSADVRVVPILEAFSFLGFPEPDRSWRTVIPIDVPKIASLVAGAKRGSLRFPARLATTMAGPLIARHRDHRLAELARPNITAQEITPGDERLANLWEKTRVGAPATPVRDIPSIKWYCSGWRTEPRVLIGASAGSELLGYVILGRVNAWESHSIEVVDLWIEQDDAGTAGALIYAAFAYGRDHGYDALLVTHFRSEIHRALERLSRFNIGMRNTPYYFRPGKGNENLFEEPLFSRLLVHGI